MSLKTILSLEFTRLFRRSSLVFLFLAMYVLLTPIGRGVDQFRSNETYLLSELYQIIAGSISIFGMLFMALFWVNNIGNEFNERSYRKLLVLGVQKKEYLTGKLLMSLLLAMVFLAFTLIVYVSLAIIFTEETIFVALGSISMASMFNQLLALYLPALFGLFIVIVFRSKTVGLIFFPFWFFTELFFYIQSMINHSNVFVGFLPGVIGWNMYNSHQLMEFKYYFAAIMYAVIFITSSWFGLKLRDDI